MNIETETHVDEISEHASALDIEIMLEMIEELQSLGRGVTEAFANSKEETKYGKTNDGETK